MCFLTLRAGTGDSADWMVNRMLKRVIVGALLILLFISVLALGGWYQCVVVSLAALLSVYELYHAFRQSGRAIFVIPAYLFAASFFLTFRIFGIEAVFLTWLACVLGVCAERVLNPKRSTQDALLGLAILVYPVVLYAVLMLIAESRNFAHSRIGLLCAFAMPLMGDTFAYFIGVSFGRRKLCPELSPNKTVIGAIGGLLGGLFGGIFVYFLQQIYSAGIPLWSLAALGLVCGAVGQIGDLFASAIKRYTGVKDYGYIFPGHGGMTDRLDSVLFCAPFVYSVFTLWPH